MTDDPEMLGSVRRFESIHRRAGQVLASRIIRAPERIRQEAMEHEKNGHLEMASARMLQAEALLMALLRSREARYQSRIRAIES